MGLLLFEFDEDVDVACGREVVAEDGAEEGELADVVAAAKRGDGFLGPGYGQIANSHATIMARAVARGGPLPT